MTTIRNRAPLVITIPLDRNLPRELSPNHRGRSHWPRTNAVAQARGDGRNAVLGAVDPNDPYQCFQTSRWPLTLHVVVARHGRANELDHDNAIASCKAYIDGIADALGVNDRNFRIGSLTQVKSDTGSAYLRIAIEPADVEARAA
jgi:crossover junction endodeoxyribonuclease RusA